MATLTFAGATRRYDASSAPAVDHLDLDIADGEFLVLVGPSGCGKSTSLRMLAGLEPVDEGHVFIDGHDMAGVRSRDRDVAMVFQSYALYPNMTVRDNMGFALRNAGVGKADTAQRVAEAARILQLEELLDRKPAKLSGGQRQRVAMGRAIVRSPKVFCMDEPLSNLDAKLRVSTRSQIAALQRRLGVTTVYVTHDQVEAMTMGDRVAVLLDGRLQQVATPEELYEQPVNAFVAAFIGSPAITLITAPVQGDAANVHGLAVPLPTDVVAHLGDPQGPGRDGGRRVQVGVRPEGWEVVSAGTPGALTLDVQLVEALGSESFVYGSPTDSTDGEVVEVPRIAVKVDKRVKPAAGERLAVAPRENELYFFDADTGASIHRRG